MRTLDGNALKVNSKYRRVVSGPNIVLKRRLQIRGVTYPDIAKLAGVSWHMVWLVVNQRKTSRRVTAAIQKLLGGVHATR